jgi:hypothetical protein
VNDSQAKSFIRRTAGQVQSPIGDANMRSPNLHHVAHLSWFELEHDLAVPTSRQLAGIQNSLGSGWPLGDDAAVAFGRDCYTSLTGETLREAVSAGREEIRDQGPTWGAYQFYGSGTTTLIASSPTGRST